MKIIKKGKVPKVILHRTKCMSCKTVFEFNEREVEESEGSYEMLCPLCIMLLTVDKDDLDKDGLNQASELIVL